jgi:hypothetical protein
VEEEEELIKQRLTKKVNDCLVLVDCGTNELTSKLHERQNEGPASCPEFLAFEGILVIGCAQRQTFSPTSPWHTKKKNNPSGTTTG